MLFQYNFMFLKGPLGLIFGPPLGPSWNYLEAPLGSSRASLELSWGLLGPSMGHVVPNLGHLGPSWNYLGLFGVLLCLFYGYPGPCRVICRTSKQSGV